ncbi:MAG: hypothetical protein CFE21_15665 [Bacteroidetes bacterium B1(2017)]|nr:MAG: hypothetical protein CFE21_15665 [Bacteroidetes bacterium B1(2017)]
MKVSYKTINKSIRGKLDFLQDFIDHYKENTKTELAINISIWKFSEGSTRLVIETNQEFVFKKVVEINYIEIKSKHIFINFEDISLVACGTPDIYRVIFSIINKYNLLKMVKREYFNQELLWQLSNQTRNTSELPCLEKAS